MPPQEYTTTAVGPPQPAVDLLPPVASLLTKPQRLLLDGTATMMLGTLIAGVATYAWQAGGTRALGKTAFAPVAATWTVYFLIVTILLAPIEQFAIRTVAAGRGGDAHLARALRTIAIVLLAATAVVAVAGYLLRSSLFQGGAGYAIVAGAIVLSLGQLALCRGILVGRRDFAAYGWVTGLDSSIRLLVGVPIVVVTGSALAFVWTIPLCSLVALAWIRTWPVGSRFRPAAQLERERDRLEVPIRRFLATTIGGTSAAQLLLAGGPLLLALLGGSASAVTVLFVAQTVCRAAFLMATPAGARSLPPLTRIALHSDYKRLGRIAVRLLGGSLMAAVALGSAALVLMPPLIAALFGSSVRPSPVIAALTVSGTVLAIGNLGLNQILVAAARTHWITTAWWVALAGALAWVMTAPGDVLHRVSTGFVLGELIALLALALASNLGLKPATKGARLARLSASAFMPARASSGPDEN